VDGCGQELGVKLDLLREAESATRWQMMFRFEDADSAAGWRSSEVHQALQPALKTLHIGMTVQGYEGARPVGLDFSARQLDHARRLMADAGVDFPLVHASAEAVPLPDASFDIVFCDFGAMTFADPYLTVPEAARLLRPGGLFAFSGHSPIATICWPLDADEVTDHLALDYFGMHAIDDGETVSSQLPYGEWVRLFRASGFVIEDLIEPRPAPDATSTYTSTEARAWARRWPAESIWRLRRG